MFADWQQNEQLHSQSLKLLMRLKNATQHVTSTLCEQLRIVLEPQLSQNLQGDFKTGKRLNMKKVISFIASNYRNDKIWLRRTLPTKRDYKILIAIDDSLSMHENNLGFFSLEASVALQEALQRLEVGKVAVARIRDRLDLIQSFEDSYGSERAAHQLSEFSFQHKGQTTADTSMANFVQDANKLLDMQNAGDALSCPFVIVLSDGRFNKENVRRYMREAREKRYLYIFVILDSQGKSDAKEKKKEQGILSLRSAVKQAGGGVKLDPYLSDFPFDYYCIVQDTQQLP
jgi:midasin